LTPAVRATVVPRAARRGLAADSFPPLHAIMRRHPARIGYLICAGVVALIAVVFWLAYGRYTLLGAIETDFSRLQQTAGAGRVAAEVGSRLAALSAGIREYVASEAIEPPERVATGLRMLVDSIAEARHDLPAHSAEVDQINREAGMYRESVDAVVSARRQRQERLNRLALSAGRLRAAADESRQQTRFMQLRDAELDFLSSRKMPEAARVAARLGELARAMQSRGGADLAADYDLAFARVVEIFGVLDEGAVRVLDEHDARLRAAAGLLGRRARAEEGGAGASFRDTLAQAARRNAEVFAITVLFAIAGAFLLMRFVIYPLNRITRTMTAIAEGDYTQAVPYAGRKDEIGQMAQALSTFRNAMLELKAAQSQAETASRHKSDFIANMSHELRTPLNAIIGLSDMLLEDADAPDTRELKESLPRIGAAAKHLLGLINEILDLSKIEAGRMTVEPSRFSAAALVEESMATLAPIARQKGLAVAVSYPPGLPEMVSDPQRVRQILINLIGNAVKFTDSGEVRAELSQDGQSLRFAVIDTGPGIAPEDAARLFQEFTQLDASPTRKFGGSGLGLALSRRMARLIGGDVTLASEVGAGSTFVLELPVEMALEGAAAERQSHVAVKRGPRQEGAGGVA
jgi:signal transduction histidine kinase